MRTLYADGLMRQQRQKMRRGLWRDGEGIVGVYEAVGHAGGIEGGGWIAVAVEENQAAGGVGAMSEFADAGVGNGLSVAPDGRRDCGARAPADSPTAVVGFCRRILRCGEQVGRHFCHHNFHDAFAVARAGDTAGICVGIAAAADERRIADAPGKFATGATGGGAGDELILFVEGNGADRAEFVVHVMLGRVRIFEATAPGGALAIDDEIFGRAERDSVFGGEFFGAGADEHHVLAFLEDGAGEADWIADAFDGRDGACF